MSSQDHRPHAFNPPNVPEPPPSYMQVCVTPLLRTSKLITLAGMTGYQPEWKDKIDTKKEMQEERQSFIQQTTDLTIKHSEELKQLAIQKEEEYEEFKRKEEEIESGR